MTTSTTLPPPIAGPDPRPGAATGRSGNLAARIAGWSARHRATAVLGWLLFVIAATALSAAIGTAETRDSEYEHGDSRRADEIIAAAGFPERANEMVRR